jgi:hypothetical protein
MSRKLALAVAFALTLLAFGPFLLPGTATRMRVQLLARQLGSEDPAVRAQARRDLIAIGRPAIDTVWPELIAGEVQDETTGVTALVFVGRPLDRPGAFEVESVVRADKSFGVTAGASVVAVGSPVCPTARALGPRDARRVLVVVGRGEGPGRAAAELRVVVSLDDDLASETVRAVQRRFESR